MANRTQIVKSTTNRKDKNKLLDLPIEITRMVFKALPATDRFCLALTCKDLAATNEMLNGEKSKKDFKHKVANRATEYTRLEILVRLKPYFAPTHKLCYKCNQFIDLTNPDNVGQWGGSEVRVAGLAANKEAMVVGPRCPLCGVADQMELTQHKGTYRMYLALGRQVSLRR